MRSTAFVLTGVILTAACGGGLPGPDVPAPAAAPALAYTMPADEPLVYEQADSGGFTMQIPGAGNVDIDIIGQVTAQLDFEPQGDALQVTVEVTDLSGRFANSMGPTVTVGNEHRPGPAVLTVAPDGEVTVVQQPSFPAPLNQILTPQTLYKGFFIRLPARGIERGVSWTDTLRTDETNEGMTVSTTTVVTSVWSRDSTVNGQTLAVIESRMRNTIQASGVTQGVEISQNLDGTSNATSLWDPAAHVLVERRETGEATGTTDLPGMGMTGLPVNAHSHQVIRLRR